MTIREDPGDWITFKKLEELFEEIDYAARRAGII